MSVSTAVAYNSEVADDLDPPGDFDPVEDMIDQWFSLLMSAGAPVDLAAALVEGVLRFYKVANTAVKQAAVRAIVERLEQLQANDLKITQKPRTPRYAGYYAVQKKGEAGPRETLLVSNVAPFGSCGCADFRHNALGLCEHLLCILLHLGALPGRWSRSARAFDHCATQAPAQPVLRWDPIKPLEGSGGWFERLRWDDNGLVAPPQEHRVPTKGCVVANAALKALPRADYATQLIGIEGLQRDFDAAWRERAKLQPEPAVGAWLREEGEHLRRCINGEDDAAKLPDLAKTLKQPLYPYQLAGVERFVRRGQLLLADDMGLGKTAQAVAAAHVLWRQGRVQRILVVVPAALKGQWVREWGHFSDMPVQAVYGPPHVRNKFYDTTAHGALVVNYEQVLRDLRTMHQWAPDFVILDEAQRIKNRQSKTAVFVKTLAPAYRLMLTGTPMENRIEELSSLLDWVDAEALAPTWRLDPHHIRRDTGGERVGMQHMDTLRQRVALALLRRDRQEVLTQLPSRSDTLVPVQLGEAQKHAHEEYVQPIARLVQMAQHRPLRQLEFVRLMSYLAYQRIICNGMAIFRYEDVWPTVEHRGATPELLESLDSPKLNVLRDLILQLAVQQNRRVVVFSQWVRMLKFAEWSVREVLAQADIQSVFFTGEVEQKRRDRNIVAFHEDPKVRVLFASDAGGVGLNLQHAASVCINLDAPWNPAVLEQRIGRIHRHGQSVAINVYNIFCDDGMEGRIAQILQTKRAIFGSLFTTSQDEVTFASSASFLGQLKVLLPEVEVPDLAVVREPAVEPTATPEAELIQEPKASPELHVIRPDATKPAAPELPEKLSGVAEIADLSNAKPPQNLQTLLQAVKVSTTADGSVRIEAPPQAAASLAQFFGTLAAQLKGIP